MSQGVQQSNARQLPNYAPGTSRDYPERESAPLQEELLFHEEGTPFIRALSCFEFRLNGEPVVVRGNLTSSGDSNLEVIGITGTMYNKEGLFAQCGWFGNYDLDWFWVCIKCIKSLSAKRDTRFRGGEWCLWLETQLGWYALLLPRDVYREMWEETAAGLGDNGLAALFRQWPAGGLRPSWWADRWQDDWPFEKEAGSKRRASVDLEHYELQAREDKKLVGKWVLLGSRGEQGNQGQMRTNLGQRDQWELSPHGMMPTRSLLSKDVVHQKDTQPKVEVILATKLQGRRKGNKRQ